MEFLKPDFTESERHVKQTLQLSEEAMHRLQQGISAKIDQLSVPQARMGSWSLIGAAVVCLLVGTAAASHVWDWSSRTPKLAQAGQPVMASFPPIQESQSWEIRLTPTFEKYTIEIIPKDTSLRRDVSVQLKNAFTSSGTGSSSGQSLTYKEVSIPDSTTRLEWIIKWKDANYASHEESITFSR